jgi:hypothetical protein
VDAVGLRGWLEAVGIGGTWGGARWALPRLCSDARSASAGFASGRPRDERCSTDTATITMRRVAATTTALHDSGREYAQPRVLFILMVLTL